MRSRNMIILFLIFGGIVLFAIVQGIVVPRMAQNEQQYIAEQQDPLTHNIESVLEYKHKYMGNAGNLSNLINQLPLNKLKRTLQLYSDIYTLEVNYQETVSVIGQHKLNQSLIYNATALFSLIDNLDAIHFNFTEVSYKILRSDVEGWYGVNLASIIESGSWERIVQAKLNDREYVANFHLRNFQVI